MKTSAIVRIIVWSLVAVILIGILVLGLRGDCDWSWIPFRFGSSVSYPNSELYEIGGGSVEKEKINNVEIHWVSGAVEVSTGKRDTVSFYEESSRTLEEDERMRYYVEGDKLIIQYSAPARWFHFFRGSWNKTLKVELPEKLLESVKIETTSSDLEAEGIQAETIKLESVSGRIQLKEVAGDELSMNTVSGKISAEALKADRLYLESVSGAVDLQGSFQNEVTGESVSGGFQIDSGACPTRVNLSTVSGSIKLWLPENDGFTARYDTVSGRFNCDFAAKASKDSAIYKDGNADIYLYTVSGGIDLMQN